MFIPKSYLARTVHHVHDHVELEVKRNGGHCDYRKAGGSRQEVRDRTGVLCETQPEGSDSAVLRYVYLHSVRHHILMHPQPVFSKYEREIIVLYILKFIIFKANGKTERSRS